jgi:hypothetical protein
MTEQLKTQIHSIANDFRMGTVGAASDAFASFINDLIAFLGSAPSDVDQAALLPLLERGLGAQQRADYIALADVLQYEIAPLLG